MAEHTPAVMHEAIKIVESCIAGLDEHALKELAGGYENDIEQVYDAMLEEAANVLSLQAPDPNNIAIDSINTALEESLRCQSLNYFITSVFGEEVDISWHHLQWGEKADMFRHIAVLAARDHGKSFFWSHLYPIWMMYKYDHSDPAQRKNNMGKGFIFSHTEGKAIDFLRDIKSTIESNDILSERLFSGQVKGWADKMIHTKNGCELNVKGFRGASRGYHPYWIVVDDVLKDETLYSPTQREKATENFKSVIMQMLVPGGQLVVVGTPFHELDLYSIFRTPEFKKWNYSEYPAIYPDGEMLWPERYSYKRLKERRQELGNVIFSREFLCKPISSDSSLFPFDILSKAIYGMENYKLVNNIEAFPIKFQTVVTGHDFAKSAKVGSDYTVFTVWGIDEHENHWLLYCWRKVGATFDEQISKLKTIHNNFRPDVMILEKNSFQTIYAEFLQNTSLPIKPHTTGTEKHQMEHGVPGLSVIFERGKFKFPYGDEHSKNIADTIMGEFNSITYTDDKGIQSVAGHDDCVMSTWFGRLGGIVATQGSFSYEFM